MSATTTLVLPRDVYDALEALANRFGGIGGGSWGEVTNGNIVTPYCAVGMLAFDQRVHPLAGEIVSDPYFTENESDDAVRNINDRRGEHRYARVPFALWAAEMGVVRGAR